MADDGRQFLASFFHIENLRMPKKPIQYPDIPCNFSPNALSIMEKHYYAKNEMGELTEHSPAETFKRVCDFYHRNGIDSEKCKLLYEYLMRQFLIFNSPVFYNIVNDKNTAQLLACFMTEFEDSMRSITKEIEKTAFVFQKGAGVGMNYSDLRPLGASIGDGGQKLSKVCGSSGPLSFLSIFNKLAEAIKAAGKRRAAQLAILDCDHPDIESFIECKSNPISRPDFINANLSVNITDSFMKAVEENKDVELKWKGVVYKKLNAKNMFRRICECAKFTGDPGVVFLDRAQEFNPLAEYNHKPFKVKTLNACSEVAGYTPYFSCNLGSINLYKIYLHCEKNSIDFIEFIGKIVQFFSDFLDKNIDVNEYPHEDFVAGTKAIRPMGIGLMGYGEMLMHRKIKYGNQEAINLAEEIQEEITLSALEYSATQNVSYPELSNIKNRNRLCDVLDKYAKHSTKKQNRWTTLIKHIRDGGHMRNAVVTTIPPTGTSGLVADGGTSGMEPSFALYHKRNVVGQTALKAVDPELTAYMQEQKIDTIDKTVILPEYFISAHEIKPIDRIKTQAAFQKFVMFGISSTINLSNTVSVEEIIDIYTEAYNHGLKGVTVFVDGCLKQFGTTQVLEKDVADGDFDQLDQEIEIKDKDLKEQNRILKITLTKTKQRMQTMEDKLKTIKEGFKRPIKIKSETYCFKLVYAHGTHEVLVDVGEIDGKPVEVIVTLGKSGTDESAWSEAVGRLISMALQSDFPLTRICKKIRGVKGDLSCFVKFDENQEKPMMIYSVPDLVAKLLEFKYIKDSIIIEGASECPSCHQRTFIYENGCMLCKNDQCNFKGSCG